MEGTFGNWKWGSQIVPALFPCFGRGAPKEVEGRKKYIVIYLTKKEREIVPDRAGSREGIGPGNVSRPRILSFVH